MLKLRVWDRARAIPLLAAGQAQPGDIIMPIYRAVPSLMPVLLSIVIDISSDPDAEAASLGTSAAGADGHVRRWRPAHADSSMFCADRTWVRD